MHPVVEILKNAKKKIRNKKNWTTRTFATTKEDMICTPKSKHAHAFCALGAIRTQKGGFRLLRQATNHLEVAAQRLYGMGVVFVNDGARGHSRIMKVYDKAIKNARKVKGKSECIQL